MGDGVKLPFECAILGALMKHPMHGYDIYKFLSSALGGVWYVGMSNVYGILKKLESDGRVSSTVEADGNRPARKVFAITEKGEGFFEDWISNPVNNIRDLRVEFITKLYFLKDLKFQGGEELVKRQKTVCERVLKSIDTSAIQKSEFSRLLYDFRSCQVRSILSWLDECVEFLQRGL
jgi:DNA-binding PadR family transcriptional regulator